MSFFFRASSYSSSGFFFASILIFDSLSFISKSWCLMDRILWNSDSADSAFPSTFVFLPWPFAALTPGGRLVPWSSSAVLVSFTWKLYDCAPSSNFLLLALPSVLEAERSHHFWSLRSSFQACSKLNFFLWLLKKISWASLRTSFLFWPLLFSLVAASHDHKTC